MSRNQANQTKHANDGCRIGRTFFAGLLLFAAAAAAIPASAMATHEECGDPSVNTGVVDAWTPESGCVGAAVTTPPSLRCSGFRDEDLGLVTVVVLTGAHPCTVAGVWVQ